MVHLGGAINRVQFNWSTESRRLGIKRGHSDEGPTPETTASHSVSGWNLTLTNWLYFRLLLLYFGELTLALLP